MDNEDLANMRRELEGAISVQDVIDTVGAPDEVYHREEFPWPYPFEWVRLHVYKKRWPSVLLYIFEMPDGRMTQVYGVKESKN